MASPHPIGGPRQMEESSLAPDSNAGEREARS